MNYYHTWPQFRDDDDGDDSVKTFPAWLPETTYLESGEKRTVQASTGPFSIVATFKMMVMVMMMVLMRRMMKMESSKGSSISTKPNIHKANRESFA